MGHLANAPVQQLLLRLLLVVVVKRLGTTMLPATVLWM